MKRASEAAFWCVSSNDPAPYDAKWAAYMVKLPKEELVRVIRHTCKQGDTLRQQLAEAQADSRRMRGLLEDVSEEVFTGCTKFGAKFNTCNCACDHVVKLIQASAGEKPQPEDKA